MQQFLNPGAAYRIHFMRHDYISETSLMEHPVFVSGAPSLEDYLAMGAGGIVTNDAWNDQYLRNPASVKTLDEVIGKAADIGLGIWLYDEYGFPSGAANGLTMEQHPEYEAAGITLFKQSGSGAGAVSWELPAGNERIVSAYFLMKDGKTLPAEISGRFVQAQSPGGEWTLCVIGMSRMYENTIASHSGNDRRMPNLLSKEAVDAFKSCTYAYYRENISRFSHVTAFFTDEPTLCEAVLTGSIPRVKISWCDELEERFIARYGYDIHTRYHCLFEGDSADDMAVRSNYRQLIGELFSENYVGNLAGWCEKNGTLFSGHFNMEENIHSHVANYGNLMKALKRQGAPGVDCLTGILENYLNENCGNWTVANWFMGPKYVGSAARLAEKNGLTMVEFCPVDLQPAGTFRTVDEGYAITNLIFFSGINHINSYVQSWSLGDPIPDKPYGSEMRAYSDYAARLAVFARQAAHDSGIGLYYPIETVQAYFKGMNEALDDVTRGKKATAIQQTLMRLTKSLWQAQTDYTFIDAESIDAGEIKGDTLCMGNVSLRSLILPMAEVLPVETAKKLLAWQQAGGCLIWLGETPSVATTPGGHEDLRALVCSQTVTETVAEAVASAKSAVGDSLRFEGTPGEALYCCRYQLDGDYWYFLVNMSADRQEARFTVDGAAGCTVYDPVTGEHTRQEGPNGTIVLRGYRSAFLQIHSEI